MKKLLAWQSNIRNSLVKIAALTLITFLVNSLAFACPCGCGALGPMSLEPSQSLRLRVYSEGERTQSTIDENRQLTSYDGPASNLRMGLSVAAALSSSWSGFVDLGFSDNFHPDNGSSGSIADPSLGARWQAPLQNVAGHWYLNPGLFSSVKFPLSKGLDEAAAYDHELDIHGNGTTEVLPGFEFELTNFALGVALTEALILRLPKKVDWAGEKEMRDYGLGMRSGLSIYYTFIGTGRVQAGVVREQRQKDKVGGELVSESGALSHAFELGGQLRVGEQKTLGLSFFRKGLSKIDRNTYAQNRISVSFSQAI